MKYISRPGAVLTLDGLLMDYCTITGITLEQYKSSIRKQQTSQHRQILMWLLYTQKDHLNLTCEDIGNIVNRDHSTVVYAHKLVYGFIEVQDKLGIRAQELYKQIIPHE